MSHMLKTTSLKGEQMASIKLYHDHPETALLAEKDVPIHLRIDSNIQ
jgi:hypothetical protein